MNTDEQLRVKLRKIEALYAGAGTMGERLATASAIERIKRRLAKAQGAEPLAEMKFTLADAWSRQLFVALCRRYGLTPYRYARQRHTTVMVRVPRSFVAQTLWPEFCELSAALTDYLLEATNRIIREEVYREAGEAVLHP